ncbi:hypothetical protein RGH81_000830 [Acinetobacter nosocomialis]|nr:hypothetical protein [Acinetobacter nosocomialis]
MDSIEFLDFCKRIKAIQPIGEVEYRQIVGRSYYCAYHKVKDKALSLGMPVDAYQGGTHITLTKTLESFKPASPKLKGIAFRLRDFHKRRILADYHLDMCVSEVMAEEALRSCEKILEELSYFK